MATTRTHGISIPRPALGGGTTKVSGHRGGARYTSRIPEIIAELPERAAAIATELAKATAVLAKDRAPVGPSGDLKDSIEGKLLPRGNDAAVMAAWYWFFVEFGTSHSSAEPFMLPAFEQAKKELPALGRAGMAHL